MDTETLTIRQALETDLRNASEADREMLKHVVGILTVKLSSLGISLDSTPDDLTEEQVTAVEQILTTTNICDLIP
jgi:hypothetical protein